jgi:hypothetical protein
VASGEAKTAWDTSTMFEVSVAAKDGAEFIWSLKEKVFWKPREH